MTINKYENNEAEDKSVKLHGHESLVMLLNNFFIS